MGDHIHPPLEGTWATFTGSELPIMTYNGGPRIITNHIHPPLEGTWETTFTLPLCEGECGPPFPLGTSVNVVSYDTRPPIVSHNR